MVVDDTISQALNRIAEAMEDSNETLKKILAHYNSVVPPMKENANRSNFYGRMADAERSTSSEDNRATGIHN